MAPANSAEKSAFKPETLERYSIEVLERNAMSHGDVPRFEDSTLKLKDGSERLVRDYHNGDAEYFRAFDMSAVAPEQPTVTATYMNLQHERGPDGTVEKTRLNDIWVHESERNQGIGSELLNAGERNAADHGAQEIYGAAPSDQPTRDWYEKRGYSFRSGFPGEEIFKVLAP